MNTMNTNTTDAWLDRLDDETDAAYQSVSPACLAGCDAIHALVERKKEVHRRFELLDDGGRGDAWVPRIRKVLADLDKRIGRATYELKATDAFEKARQEQPIELTPVATAAGNAVLRATMLAMDDVRNDLQGRAFRVVSAPTGSGKSLSAAAMIAAGFRTDPEFTCAYVVDTIALADEMGGYIADLIGKENVCVWTTAHDAGAGKYRREALDDEYGPLKMLLRNRQDLLTARVVVVTHAAWKIEMTDESRRDQGVRFCNGERRSVVFVDEHPDLVKLIEQTPGDLTKLRDRVYRVEPDHPFIPVLERIAERADVAFKSKGSTYADVDLVEPDDAMPFRACRNMLPYVDKGLTEAQELAQRRDMEETCSFIIAASQGNVFANRGNAFNHRSLIAYELEFTPGPGHVLLDATADITGMTVLMKGMDHVDVPTVDYSGLDIVHMDQPSQYKFVKEVVRRRRTAIPYATWIRDKVLKNTAPDDKVLVVCHKALIDHGYMDPDAWADPDGKDFAGRWERRQTQVINWGSGIGSNKWEDYNVVFLFGEFHVPRQRHIANAHGWAGKKPTASSLAKAGAGSPKGDLLTAQDGHLLRWTKQLASRGCMRNIDQDGRCGEMKLFTSMDLDRLLKNWQTLFPGADTPKIQKTRMNRKGKQDKKPAQLTRLLAATTKKLLWATDIEQMVGIPSRNLSTTIGASSTAQAIIGARGWRPTTRKEQGLTGKGAGLVRD